MKIAFDLDGTLIYQVGEKEDTPRYKVIQLLQWFIENGDEVFVWSTGGEDYAAAWAKKLGLADKVTVVEKGSFVPDIAVDDDVSSLGKANIKV